MKVLVIGGTGLISVGIVKHLLARGAEVSVYNRGKRPSTLPASVEQITGDRSDSEAFGALGRRGFDAVIDMIGFSPAHAEATIATFSGRAEQLLFCSTCCVYGVDIPSDVVIDETYTPKPTSNYGKDKLRQEQLYQEAASKGAFQATIIRPSCTYGPGSFLIDQLEFDTPVWGRIERGLPVLCGGDGLGLWQATHRDDVGKLFAYSVLNPKTYGRAYNATRDEVFTWRDFYRQGAEALGKKAKVLFAPTRWIVNHDPERFGLIRETTGFHGAYDSSKAKRDVPEFRCEIAFAEGARETLEDIKRRGVFRSETDSLYERMVEKALAFGIEPEEL
jgi:nucleoside-diphosphate-sugar epimerase